MAKLAPLELNDNLTSLSELTEQASRELNQSLTDDEKNRLIIFFANYMEANLITLKELIVDDIDRVDEKAGLIECIKDAIQKKEQNAILAKLSSWKSNLIHAVSGQGLHVTHHTPSVSVTDVTEELLQKGYVDAGFWLSDSDFVYCIGLNNIIDPEKITSPDTHILTPKDLNRPNSLLKDSLYNALSAIKNIKTSNQDSLLLFPLNCGGDHWCLGEFSIHDAKMTQTILWDPMSGDESTSAAKTYFQNLTKLAPNAKIEFASEQTTGWDCMDLCIKRILEHKNITNDITEAKTPNERRLAIVKQIASNHPQLGPEFAAKLNMKPNGRIDTAEPIISQENSDTSIRSIESVLEKISTTGKDIKKEEKDFQVTFDSIFAQHLQSQYNLYKNKSESDQIKAARDQATKNDEVRSSFNALINSKKR